ncbi:hypothetical protein HZH66_004926 [Vespula vulgaris]|uniref:Uncharacterized protein n=1 Tax=Vespula vulgaris TaxID=7454 RepID=A0A834KD51_VESVU|nr:hypothetical protein HZH66_004926 [Vespula vulgaris]
MDICWTGFRWLSSTFLLLRDGSSPSPYPGSGKSLPSLSMLPKKDCGPRGGDGSGGGDGGDGGGDGGDGGGGVQRHVKRTTHEISSRNDPRATCDTYYPFNGITSLGEVTIKNNGK